MRRVSCGVHLRCGAVFHHLYGVEAFFQDAILSFVEKHFYRQALEVAANCCSKEFKGGFGNIRCRLTVFCVEGFAIADFVVFNCLDNIPNRNFIGSHGKVVAAFASPEAVNESVFFHAGENEVQIVGWNSLASHDVLALYGSGFVMVGNIQKGLDSVVGLDCEFHAVLPFRE